MDNQVFKICVLLSTYNGEKYIREQLNSILGQIGVEIVLLIRDDGSKDGTVDILNEYAQQYPNVFLYAEKNLGVQRSFMQLSVYAEDIEADYYAFADQDDVWLSDKLKAAVINLKIMDQGRPAIYFSNLIIADKQLQKMGEVYHTELKPGKKASMVRNYAYGCTMVFNRSALEHFVKNPDARMWMHDYWLFLIGEFLGNVVYDKRAFILYRQHEDNAVGGKRSFTGRMKRKLYSLTQLHKRPREDMIKDFLDCFSAEMTQEDAVMMERFCEYRKGMGRRIQYAFDKDYRVYDRKTNFFLAIRFLIGSV